ncbi:MAG: hypothetical protein BWY28_00726 [bacterium ADurb.Bin236]|nr:MAG: hypothetical protein BWY28_00726 [bacterium ADurb.Bin236]
MSRKKRQIELFFAFAALIALTKIVAAENKFNYQGYVTESGVPMHGSVPMVFELFDVSTGGAPLCSTGAQSVSVSRGRFNYVVGSEAGGCGAVDIDWSAGDFFLQVSVNGNTLSPREKVVPFPVALEAKKLNGLQAADFVLSGSANWLETSGGILTGPLTVEADIISSGDITAATGTITAAAFIGDGSGLTGLAGSDDSRVLKTGDTMTGALTVAADFFTSGNISAATGTVTALAFMGDGSGLTGVVAAGSVAKTGDTMSGSLVVDSDLAVSGEITSVGDISAPIGTVTASAFIGDGSGLTGVSATDNSRVLKTGDTMTGALVVQADFFTAGDITAATGTITAAAFVGDGSGLTGIVASGGVAKTGDTMTGPLTVDANIITSGDITAATGTITADAFVGDGSGLTGIVATGGVAKTGDTMTGSLTVDANIITSGDITAATGTITADAFVGDGSGLTGIVATGGVAKTGDTMTGPLTVDANIITSGDITAATGTITAAAFVGDGTGITGISATDNTKVLKTGDTMTGQLNTQNLTPTVSGVYSLGTTDLEWNNIYGRAARFRNVDAYHMKPRLTNLYDLGADTLEWRYLYLAGGIYLGGSPLALFGSVADSAGTTQFSSSGLTGSLQFAGGGLTSVSFDNVNRRVTYTTSLATLTRGTGLTGSNYAGTAGTTWAVDFGTTAGTVAEGNHAHAGMMSGSGTADRVAYWNSASTVSSGGLYWDNTNSRLGVAVAPGTYALNVSGTANISGATTLGGTLGVTGAITGSSTVQGTRLISTIATGTAPLTLASTTVVTNLNADLLDGNHASSFSTSGHTHATLTRGTGLTGSNYDGSAATTWAVSYGTTAGTAVQGNTTVTITAGTGMSGGGSITLGAGGTVTLTNTDAGSSQYIFKNIADTTPTTQFSASTNNDTVQFAAGGRTTVAFTPASKRVTYTTTLNTLTRGTGLTGSNYDGSASTTWSLDKSQTNCYFSSVTTLTGTAQDTTCAAGFCCAAVINADTDIAMGIGKHDGASLYFNSAFEDFTSLKIMCCPCQ